MESILLVALLCLAPSIHADSITLWPDADTTLLEVFPDNNFGGAPFFNAGTTQNGPRNRGLLRFDVAGSVPPGSVILKAFLTVEVTRQPKDGYEAGSMELHRMLRSWGEGDKISLDSNHPGFGSEASTNEATWNQRFAGTTNAWAAPGGGPNIDYATNISSAEFIYDVGNSPYTFASTPRTVADVQLWLDDPKQNFGWILKAEEEDARFTARQYGSRESPNEDLRPKLTIDFTPPPRIFSLGIEGTRTLLTFAVEAGAVCRVETTAAFAPNTVWMVATNIPVSPSGRLITVTNEVGGSARFYRLAVTR